MTDKPVLAIGFIGCVAQNYDKNGSIIDGFFNWALEAFRHFDLVIHDDEVPVETMETFVRTFQIPWRHQKLAENQINARDELSFLFVQGDPTQIAVKPFLTINTHAITFTGRWNMPFLNPTELLEFKPWMEPHVLYKLPAELGRPDAAQRASVAPPPDAQRKCPKHPWMTQQNPDGSRECTINSCSWRSEAPIP